MKPSHPFVPFLLAATTIVGVMAAAPALAGPPGICQSVTLGDRLSAVDAAWAGIDKANLLERLPAALDACPRALERMELLRRAATLEESRAMPVITTLALRAAELGGKPAHAAALFDAGYAINLYSTLGSKDASALAKRDGVAGYALIARAVELAPQPDAGMHVGAAFMTIPGMHRAESAKVVARTHFLVHAHAALATIQPGSPEEKNLDFVLQFDDLSVASLRAQARSK